MCKGADVKSKAENRVKSDLVSLVLVKDSCRVRVSQVLSIEAFRFSDRSKYSKDLANGDCIKKAFN